MSRFGLPLALTFACLAGGPALALAGGCVDLCRIPCVKPISIADRWDDVTGIPGYMGETDRPDWRNDGQFNREPFFDENQNGLWDSGESFTDFNGNLIHDEQLYDPETTGYVASRDPGLEIVLHLVSAATGAVSGHFMTVALPPVNKGTPESTGDAYRFAWAHCAAGLVEPGDVLKLHAGSLIAPTNEAMRDVLRLDPHAVWDEATQQVQGSEFALSPRILFLPVHDPRVPVTGANPTLLVRKVVAFFAEQMVGSAEVRGRLLRVQAPGETCGGGSAGGFVVQCPVPATPASWGRVKAAYR